MNKFNSVWESRWAPQFFSWMSTLCQFPMNTMIQLKIQFIALRGRWVPQLFSSISDEYYDTIKNSIYCSPWALGAPAFFPNVNFHDVFLFTIF